ncbi:MAG TPA: ABC transporter permease [Acidimicrobiia bacterium]|jgi:peptide/nickel transport system permease protein|nr:ABC transporter permease [Acidimicrobiia bacterium]
MTTTAPPAPASAPVPPARTSARAIVRARRRRAFARVWRTYRSSLQGMVGLAILVVFVGIAVFAPLITSSKGLDVTNTTHNPTLAAPSSHFIMGTDELGRSVWTLFVWGSRISLFVGLAATIIAIALGAGFGIVAGYAGGRTEGVLMRITEFFLVIPFIPLAVVLASVLHRSLSNIIFVIGITSWPGTARLIRAQVLSVKTRLYVDRARGLGAGHWHVISRHILPNVMPLIFANLTLTVPIAILSESTLSFLGLGDPLRISWGVVLENAFDGAAVTLGAWWYYLAPGLGIILVALAFTMCGRALEEILDPRLVEAQT